MLQLSVSVCCDGYYDRISVLLQLMVTINEVACPLKKILVMLDMAEVTLCFSCPCASCCPC